VRFLYLIFVAAVLLGGGRTFADEHLPSHPRPLLELGIGMGSTLTPDYPGSDQEHYHFAAFPVLFYHGKIFRSDRDDGARARVINKPVFGIDVSGSGSFPIDSDDNRARSGMKSLGWLGEVGPRAFARLLDNQGQLWRVFVTARPAVSARATEVKARGVAIASGMLFEHKRFLVPELSWFGRLSGQWGTQEFNDYYYSVPDQYATPERPSYNAKAGYYGTWLTGGVSYEFSDVIVSTGLSAISVAGSANRDSPLMRDDLNWSFFVGFAWFFYHSSEPGYF
jgi:outer membrane scaffolding protein for murein synthesis (MipA/OmpV family)